MAIYKLKDARIESLKATSVREEGLRERQDLQRLLQEQIHVVDPNVMVLAEEFGRWEDSKRRIDLLGLDRDARLVVIELKRTEDGGHMELQALRYAAMVSRMTFEQAVDAHSRWLANRGDDSDAERAILDFLGWSEPDEERFGQDVRIVLISGDFSKELTTSVLWMNERDLDVRCVRIRPYSDAGQVLVDVQQVIPLPEAGEYMVQVREKERRQRESRASERDYTRFDVTVDGVLHEKQAKRHAVHLVAKAVCAKGATPEQVAETIHWRGIGRTWCSTEGTLDDDQFAAQMAAESVSEDRDWHPRRWHLGIGNVIHSGGRSWVFSNQWGKSSEEAIRLLLARWPNCGVVVEVSSS